MLFSYLRGNFGYSFLLLLSSPPRVLQCSSQMSIILLSEVDVLQEERLMPFDTSRRIFAELVDSLQKLKRKRLSLPLPLVNPPRLGFKASCLPIGLNPEFLLNILLAHRIDQQPPSFHPLNPLLDSRSSSALSASHNECGLL